MTLYTKAGQAAEEIDNDEVYLTSTELRAFKRHVAGLNKLILDVRARYPDGNLPDRTREKPGASATANAHPRGGTALRYLTTLYPLVYTPSQPRSLRR